MEWSSSMGPTAMVSSARNALPMSCRARIRCSAVVAVAMAAQLIAVAQSPAARAKDLRDRAVELDQRGNAAAALSLLWEAAGLAPQDGAIQDQLGEALERIG